MNMKKKVTEALVKSIPEETKDRVKKKTLKALSLSENSKKAIGIAKAVASKKFNYKLSKHFNLEVDASDNKDKKIKLGYTKGF